MSDNEQEKNEETSDGLDDTVIIGVGILAVLVGAGILVVLSTTGMFMSTGLDEFDYPAGASADGVENSTELLSGHASKLRNTSYEIVATSTAGNNTTTTTFRYNNDSQVSYRVVNGTDQTAEVYDNYTPASRQRYLVTGLGTESENFTRQFVVRPPFTGDRQVAQLASASNLSADRVTEGPNGEDVVVYEVQNVAEQFQSQFNIDGEIHISSEGYVTVVDVTVETLQNGTVVATNNQELEITGLGSTQVEEPSWLQDAINQTERAEAPQLGNGTNETTNSTTNETSG